MSQSSTNVLEDQQQHSEQQQHNNQHQQASSSNKPPKSDKNSVRYADGVKGDVEAQPAKAGLSKYSASKGLTYKVLLTSKQTNKATRAHTHIRIAVYYSLCVCRER